jgi:putative transcriptional regulator
MPIRFRLPELRARQGRLTLTQLSQDTGIALSNLSKLDRSLTARIDLTTLETLCRYFKVTPGDLLELVDADPASEVRLS